MIHNTLFAPLRDSSHLDTLVHLSRHDSTAETAFDRLARLATRVLHVSAALISLKEADRIFFKGGTGLPEPWATLREIPLSQSLCQYTIASARPFIINDIRDHDLFYANPLLDTFQVTAYAGVPLITSDGTVLGAFCIVDTIPRMWTEDELATLQDLAAAAMTEIELRREVIEQAQAAEALKIRFSTVVEHLGEGLLIADTQDTVLYANPGIADLTGFSLEELIGRTAHEILLESDVWPMTQARYQQHTQGIPERYELMLKRKQGGQFCAEVSATTLRNTAGEVIGTLRLIADITQRKQLEMQLLHAQKMECIGQLAGGVAHDFNNLLTIILSSAQFGMNTSAPGTQAYNDLEEIHHAATQATTLTRQLLTFSRQQVMEPQVIDLNDLIFTMDRLLRRVIGADVELVTLPGTPLRPIKVDPGQIEQVLINLAVNARDAMPTGGKLTIKTANVMFNNTYTHPYIDVQPGPYVCLTISDTGSGMDATVKEHLFEPFFTTKESGKGTGLGLATSYGIIQQHGGSIDVWSEPDRGATFMIYLPCTEEVQISRVSTQQNSDLPRGTETVLLVEDEPLVRLVSARVLQDLGYTVLESANGDEALRMIQTRDYTFNLLLTDVVMPQMGGIDLAAEVRALYPETKILFTSGYTNTTVLRREMLDMHTAFLPKPFLPKVLATKVRELLDR